MSLSLSAVLLLSVVCLVISQESEGSSEEDVAPNPQGGRGGPGGRGKGERGPGAGGRRGRGPPGPGRGGKRGRMRIPMIPECDEFYKAVFKQLKELIKNKEISSEDCKDQDPKICVFEHMVMARNRLKDEEGPSEDCLNQVKRFYEGDGAE